MTNRLIRTSCIMLSMLSLFSILGCEGVLFPLPYRSLAPFKGKVIDTDTKKPIEGAVVLALYYYETYSIAGANLHLKDGQETLTDRHGEFILPRTRRWFTLNRGYPEGTLEIFKPGYGLLVDRRSKAIGDNKSWPTPEKYVVYELPKLKTIEERRKVGLYSYDEIPYKYRKMYFTAKNKERIFLGYRPLPVPK